MPDTNKNPILNYINKFLNTLEEGYGKVSKEPNANTSGRYDFLPNKEKKKEQKPKKKDVGKSRGKDVEECDTPIKEGSETWSGGKNKDEFDAKSFVNKHKKQLKSKSSSEEISNFIKDKTGTVNSNMVLGVNLAMKRNHRPDGYGKKLNESVVNELIWKRAEQILAEEYVVEGSEPHNKMSTAKLESINNKGLGKGASKQEVKDSNAAADILNKRGGNLSHSEKGNSTFEKKSISESASPQYLTEASVVAKIQERVREILKESHENYRGSEFDDENGFRDDSSHENYRGSEFGSSTQKFTKFAIKTGNDGVFEWESERPMTELEVEHFWEDDPEYPDNLVYWVKGVKDRHSGLTQEDGGMGVSAIAGYNAPLGMASRGPLNGK